MSSEKTKQIESGSEVIMHVKIMLRDKSVAQDTKDENLPVKALIGGGYFTENFERHLLGLRVGDKNVFMVDPDDSFGQPAPENIHMMPRDQFPKDEVLEQGVIFMFKQPDGNEMPGVIRDVQGDQVRVDFNHPLCGQQLIFEVEVLDIETPLKH